MNQEINNTFIDIRNAFRLLYRYQSRVLSIIKYIREQTVFPAWGNHSVWGRRLFCNPIGTVRTQGPDVGYANLDINLDMWGWDFLYNYVFEYYFGQIEFEEKNVDMSIIQVSDDGFYKSKTSKPSPTNISTFNLSEDSNSYLIFAAGNKWMCDEIEKDFNKFLHKFLASDSFISTFKDENEGWFIAKKYPMINFVSQVEADKIIRDFDNLIHEFSAIKIFK